MNLYFTLMNNLVHLKWSNMPSLPNNLMNMNLLLIRYFSFDSSFGNMLPHRRSMQSNCGLYNGVAIAWTTNMQNSVATNSTDAELWSLHYTLKRIVSFLHFLTSSAMQQALTWPVTLYADNNAAVKIIVQNKISSRSRHLDIPVNFSY